MFKLEKINKKRQWINTSPEEGDFVLIPERLALGQPLLDTVGSVYEVKYEIDYLTETATVTNVYVMTFNASNPFSVDIDTLIYIPEKMLKRLLAMYEAGDEQGALNLLIRFSPNNAIPLLKKKKGELKMSKQENNLVNTNDGNDLINPISILQTKENSWTFKVIGKTKTITGTATKKDEYFWFTMTDNLPYKHFMWVKRKIEQKINEEYLSVAQ